MHTLVCLVSPAQCAATSIAKASLGDLFGALTAWVLSSVGWLLHATATVLNATGEPASIARAASPEFVALLSVAPILLLVSLLVATLHSLRHGDMGALWRSFLGVAPGCVVAIAIARPVATTLLEAVNELCTTAGSTVPAGEVAIGRALSSLGGAATPGFGLFVLSGLVVLGGVLLWCELVVRAVVLTLLIVLVPVIVPLAAIPAMRRIGWRLAETFVAVAASKFLIVVTLALGLSEVSAGGATTVITGAVTLGLASASPFVILRLIPFVESSALHGVEGLRQRATRTVATAPSSPAGAVVAALAPDAPLPGPPERPEDWGIPLWEPGPDPDWEMPSFEGEPPPPPVGEPILRTGHAVYTSDAGGPVIGWHFDD